jgi:hypothetical protein
MINTTIYSDETANCEGGNITEGAEMRKIPERTTRNGDFHSGFLVFPLSSNKC